MAPDGLSGALLESQLEAPDKRKVLIMTEYAAPPPAPPHTKILEVFDYADAQKAVDTLSDAGVPVEGVQIVGHDIKSVEVVTGRMTTPKAAGLGALSGLWFGLFVGLLFGIFAIVGWFSIVLTAVILGAVFGAIAGAVGHALTRGKRDFASAHALEATRYEVLVPTQQADNARSILGLQGQ